jgi:hypothetical protein
MRASRQRKKSDPDRLDETGRSQGACECQQSTANREDQPHGDLGGAETLQKHLVGQPLTDEAIEWRKP